MGTNYYADGDTISRQAAIDALKALEEPAPTAQHLIAIFDCEDAITGLPSAQPEIIHCRDCKHRPVTNDSYDEQHSGFNIEFPDYRCPCQCDDPYYNRLPDSDWFCGNAERREE